MAKNKRKRNWSGAGRTGTMSPGRGAPAARSEPPQVSVKPATPGGPNRQARKDEARRQREALHRKMARRRFLRITTMVIVVLVVAAAATTFVLTRPNPAKAAGCGSLQTISPFNPVTQDRSHIGAANSPVTTPPPLTSYPSRPPTSGPHDGAPLAAGVYTEAPGIYHVLHSLEHGAVIIWYSPSAAGSTELTKIEDLFRQPSNQDHVIVAPYNYPDQGAAGQLPKGTSMVLVFWHHSQSCDRLSLDAAKSFVDHFRIPSTGIPPKGYPVNGGAPEPGSPIG